MLDVKCLSIGTVPNPPISYSRAAILCAEDLGGTWCLQPPGYLEPLGYLELVAKNNFFAFGFAKLNL